MIMNSEIAVAAAIIAAEADLNPEDTLEDRLRAAMKVGRSHWMITDEDQRLRASVAAVLLHCTDEERARIEIELQVLRNFGAAMSGVPVDMSRVFGDIDPENIIGLLGLWQEAKAKQ